MTVERRLVMTTVISILICLVLSCALYERTETAWGGADFKANAERTSVGLPIPWLVVTTIDAHGEFPAFQSFPGYERWIPGVSVRTGGLLVFLALSFCCGVGLGRALFWFTAPSRALSTVASWVRLLAVAIVALVVGFLVPTDAEWVGVVLGVGLIPAVLIVATWSDAKLPKAALFSASATAALWWGSRFTDHFRVAHLIREVDVMNDLISAVAFFMWYIFVQLLALGLRKTAEKLKKKLTQNNAG